MEYAKFDNTDVVQQPDELGLPLPWPFPKKLEKLTGTLTEFKAVLSKGPFEGRFYVRLAALAQGKSGGLTQEEVSAVMLSAAGHGVAAFTSFNKGPEFQPAMYIFAELDGKPLRGWVNFSEFKIGDEVEIAAEWTGEHYEVYAIIRPKDEVVTVYPLCDCGVNVLRKMVLKTQLILFSVVWLFGFLMFAALQGDWLLATYFAFSLAGVMCGISAIGTYREFRKTNVVLAERIFSALGWQNVKNIYIVAMTDKKREELRNSGKEPILGWDFESYLNDEPTQKEAACSFCFYYDTDTVYGRKEN